MKNLLKKLDLLRPLIGNTPVVELAHPFLKLQAKLEFFSLTGSVKDRSAFYALRKAIERGEVSQETIVIESSSGNFASSLAQICSYLGIKFIPVVDPNISPLNLKFIESFCSDIIKVKDRDSTGGFLTSRLVEVQKFLKLNSNCYWVNQYENSVCAEAHYFTTASEILRDCDKLDYLFLGVSSGGTLNGVSRGVKENSSNTKIIAVDIEGSMVFQSNPKARFIPGMGSSIRPKLIEDSIIDEIIHVSERDVVVGCNRLRYEHGVFAGGSSGAVLFAIDSYFRNHKGATPGTSVTFLCPDRGTAYLDTVYNEEWVRSKGLV